MERVIGIGGIFFRARDPEALQAWYARHLGIDVQDWGGAAFEGSGTTVWSIQADGPTFTVNYRVSDVRALLDTLREEGCDVVDDFSDTEYGKFGWVVDPEGNKIELWEPAR